MADFLDKPAGAVLPPISVIIPCYKAASTLPNCVESVLAGAPANLEVLLVEDGSPDNTGAVCDNLAARWAEKLPDGPRVMALHRPNGGAGAARNTGLDAAIGEWILFLDADDTLLPGLWQALPQALAAAPNLGLVVFGLVRATTGPVACPAAPGLYQNAAALGDALRPLLFETGYFAAPYPKLFCARQLRAAGVRFSDRLAVNEDVLFNIQFLQISTPIYFLTGVYYYQNDKVCGSLSRQLRGDLLDAEVITHPALAELCRRLALPPEKRDALLAESRTRACLNQYGLLVGRRGALPFGRRRALFAEILADAPARKALRAELAADPNRLLALPYRLGVGAGLPGWLAAYTMFKNQFLP